MSNEKNIFEYSTREDLSVPRWVELIVIIIGLPIVLGIMYFFVFPLIDSVTAIITFIIIAIFGIWLVFKSEETGDTSLHMRVDDFQITCKLGAKTSAYDLRKLDWSRVKMTNEILSSLILKEDRIDNERSYPISLMSRSNRRELWKKITQHKK